MQTLSLKALLQERSLFRKIYDTSYPKEEVYIQMTDFFDEFINEINSVFASSGCGLSVKDFGFKLF